jgi:penicillin amidase
LPPCDEFSVPSQNFVYADVTATSGMRCPGLLPVRDGFDGSMPVTDAAGMSWRGSIDAAALQRC